MSDIMTQTAPIWQKEAIGKDLKLTSGFPCLSKLFSTEDGFPLIRIRDIVDSKIETFYKGPYLSSYVIKKADVLIGMDGDFNITRWKNEDALLNQRVLKVEVYDSTRLSLNFVYYWLQPYIKKVNDLTAATTVKHLSVKDLYKAVGSVPEVHVQHKIATILSTIDTAIEKTEALIAKYQQIKAGLMHDLFTRGVLPNGQLRPSRDQAPELYHETAIGWIPRDWEARKLEEALSLTGGYLQTGPFGSQLHAHEYTEEGIPVIMPQDINNGLIDTGDIARITEARAKTLSRHRVQVGDIIIARRGELSRAAAISDREKSWLCGTGCFLLRLSRTNLNHYFIAHTYRHDTVQRQVTGLAVGTTMPSLNNEIMNKLVFPFPDTHEQERIILRLDITDNKIRAFDTQTKKLHNQKLGLMQDLLTGKVPVSVEEPEATYG